MIPSNQIDLRKELKGLIDKSGHWIVVRQAVPGRICPCIDPVSQDAAKDCNVCLGNGRAYIDRFTKGRKSRPVKLVNTLDMESNSSLGIVSTPETVFYFEFYIRPTSNDYVLELALDPTTQEPLTPYSVLSVYDITDARELRDINGRIEYWAVTSQRRQWTQFTLSEYGDLPRTT